jgi:Tfp pilus assembly pilus retraction ATPase PilT
MTYAMSELLQLMVSEGSSDLHIRVGVPPVIRVHGILQCVEGLPLQSQNIKEPMQSTTSGQCFQAKGQLQTYSAGNPHQSADLGTNRQTN